MFPTCTYSRPLAPSGAIPRIYRSKANTKEACALLDDVARSVEVTVAPGNHDIYLPSILHEGRFAHHFARFMQSDLPQFARELPAGHYPCVKLRGPVAIIALSSPVPRPPFVSAGHVGRTSSKLLLKCSNILKFRDARRSC